MSDKKKIAIIGATGYTGSELVRILHNHPEVEISVITSESKAGKHFHDVHPFFYGIDEHKLISSGEIDEYEIDLAFLALPHGVSMDFVRKHHDKSYKIIDLSGDFRLKTPEVYKEWYNKEHSYPEGFSKAVFGLPELYREDIEQADLVANPGCYPTSALLGAAPIIQENLVGPGPVIVDSKSGVTGAGVKSSSVTHYSNANENFRAYGLKKHRHTIEIQEILEKISGRDVNLQFTPHLLPVDRGILSTIYSNPVSGFNAKQLLEVYKKFYSETPFVRVRKEPPAIKDVRGSNYCDVYATYDERTNLIIVISVIDNLVKGAAGQAVQNMNIMFGWDETTGLHSIPVSP